MRGSPVVSLSFLGLPGGIRHPVASRYFAVPVMALVAALAVGLLFLLPGGLIQAQDSTTIEYAENGEDPVATFTAEDPEGVTPIAWTVLASDAVTTNIDGVEDSDRADGTHFDISKDGVLTFDIGGDTQTAGVDISVAPDFEAPKGEASPTTPLNNTYKVVVVACDVALDADGDCPATGNAGYHKVTVKVTEVDEPGEVSWTVTPASGVANVPPAKPIVQFQVGAVLTVPEGDPESLPDEGGVTDGDVSGTDKDVDERWQWYRSSSKTATGTAIEGATGTRSAYTVTPEDVGKYIRVEAFYNISDTAREESASRVSDYPVLSSQSDNDDPEFAPDDIEREVSEGKKGRNVGAPVRATDDITNALSYSLSTDANTSPDSDKFEIDQKTGQIKTKVDLDREGTDVADADTLGSCSNAAAPDPDPECTVTVIATDSAGATAEATVTIELTNVDEKPKFTSGTGTEARSPMRIMSTEGRTELHDTTGETPTAEDLATVVYAARDEDGLNVNLSLMGTDAGKFRLGAGGILSFKEKPDYEMPGDANKDNVYEVTVRASDGTMYADRMVKVTVTGDDEAPEITGREDTIEYAENGEDPVATFTAEDPEGVTPIAWTVLASDAVTTNIDGVEDSDRADGTHFDISKDGVLTFDIGGDTQTAGVDISVAPDFEAPRGEASPTTPLNNTYKVVVVACDVALDADGDCPATGNAGYHKVTVKVTEVDEPGEVSWTVTPASGVANVPPAKPIVQFQVGAVLTVPEGDPESLPDEGGVTDGDVSGTDKDVDERWQWYRSSSKTATGTAIEGATGTRSAYTVTSEDVGKYIRVEASYRISDTAREESASRVSDYPVLSSQSDNDDPEFAPDDIEREVSEGKKGRNVGAPVRATDDITNALSYSLSTDANTSPDSDKFEIDQKTGQIKTKVDLDREGTDVADADTLGSCSNAAAPDPDPECTVTVIATDSAGATAEATVTIELTNVDEKPKFTSGTGTEARSPMRIMSTEGRTELHDTTGETPTAEDLATVVYAARDEDGLNVNLSLMGTDAGKFRLGAGGILSFKEKPDYEMPGDANKDNVYEVTVRASDGTMYADRMVKVTVTGDDEAPEIMMGGLRISGDTSVSLSEGDTTTVGSYTAAGPNAASARWTLEGDDMGDFTVSPASGASVTLQFRNAPNYESAADANTDNVYMVTLNATDGTDTDTHEVMVTVTNVDEDGTVSLSSMEPLVGTALTASLSDPDGSVTGETWQWAKADAMDGDFADIDGAASAAYTPVAADAGMYLRATVSYADGEGSGKSAMKVTANAVGQLVITGPATVSYAEDRTNAVATYTASGPNAASVTWSLTGADMGDFNISSAGVLTFKTQPDFEAPADADTNNVYQLTVTATDGVVTVTKNIVVTVTVTNVEEKGTVTLTMETDKPRVGTAITASLSDPDGSVTGATWQWARADAMDGTFTDIDGAASAAYTPVQADVGMYLRATVSYTDGEGSGKSAMKVTADAVLSATGSTVGDRYDADGNGEIDKGEMITAINAYLFGEGDDAITKAQMIEVINLYLFGDDS